MIPEVPDGWEVNRMPAYRALKQYVCPSCGNAIAARVGHVVAWPQDRPDERRHWHDHCWRIAVRSGRL